MKLNEVFRFLISSKNSLLVGKYDRNRFSKYILSVNVLEKGYRQRLEIFSDDRPREVEDVLGVKRVARHFQSLRHRK